MKFFQCITLLISWLVLSGCQHLFYHPTRLLYTTPEKLQLEFTAKELTTEDGETLQLWHLPTTSPPAKALVVQFHGNAENMTSHFLSMVWLLEQGYDVLTFDYRGYGASTGVPSSPGIRLDAEAIGRYAASCCAPNRQLPLVFWGQSLGGAIVADLLSRPPLPESIMERSVMVFESSFLSYQDIARDRMAQSWLTWLLQPLAYVLISDELSAWESFPQLTVPLLVIHGEADGIIPAEFGKEAFARAGSSVKELLLDPDAAHINSLHTEDPTANRKKVLEFLKKTTTP